VLGAVTKQFSVCNKRRPRAVDRDPMIFGSLVLVRPDGHLAHVRPAEGARNTEKASGNSIARFSINR
jgi:hypothetical protein